jgi:hypothetical protein
MKYNSLRRLPGLVVTCFYPPVPSSEVDSEDMSQIRIRVWNRMSIQSITQVILIIFWRQHRHSPIDDPQNRGGECEMFHDR